jgi:hypothetical protein
MNYVPRWERLSEAVDRVSTTAEIARAEAQTDIARAIADGAIDFRAKLGRRRNSGTTFTKGLLERKDFRIPAEINSEDLDWVNSRPSNPWYVKRGTADVPHGDWTLEWIQLSSADVMKALPYSANAGQPQPTTGKRDAKPEGGRAFESARRVLDELYPKGIPGQVAVSHKALCRLVSDQLKRTGQQKVSDDTILRAAGRRK